LRTGGYRQRGGSLGKRDNNSMTRPGRVSLGVDTITQEA
jgi:hypothetical protein